MGPPLPLLSYPVNHLGTDETKVIYHIDDEETPYLVKVAVPPDRITLADFKANLSLPKPNYKFFFKSHDDEIGIVKEELVEDDAKLPIFKGRVVAWLVTNEGSNVSDNSQCTELSQRRADDRLGIAYHAGGDCDSINCTTETDSCISSRRYQRYKNGQNRRSPNDHYNHGGHHRYHYRDYGSCDSPSLMTSDVDSTSLIDSEDDDDDDETTSRISTTTDETSVSRIHQSKHRRRRKKHRMPSVSRTSSISSITDSSMSLNIITVTLNLDTVNFLGISIVGQSSKNGDGGIYVGSIMKGGAVALDGRVEPGDMILQVNDINFENKSNDEAVQILREAVSQPGPIKLVVAKCWDPNPKGYFTIPRSEPVRPIDPGAWVAHTEAARAADFPLRPPSVSTLTSNSSSLASSIPESDRQHLTHSMEPSSALSNLSVDMDMMTIAKAMAAPDSGLDVKDRMWLKITIPNAFLGSNVVDWLLTYVQGFQDRRDARKYASEMLKQGYIKFTVNKSSFSEKCYYIFGDDVMLASKMASLKMNDENGVSNHLLHHPSIELEKDSHPNETESPPPPPLPGSTSPLCWLGPRPETATF